MCEKIDAVRNKGAQAKELGTLRVWGEKMGGVEGGEEDALNVRWTAM